MQPQGSRWCDHSPRARHLECEVKWALGSITMNKARGGDGIPAEVFQILKDDTALNVRKFGKLSSGHRTRKGQFSFQQTTTQLHSSHMQAK